ncbi:hypothetical protein [Nonomuraea sp. B19D2]|uniref:hypothetical protein n=1 Tax=Nonomuraea sp. B19D2 TaxID=3159561 RepID=UPI0032D9DAFA
MNRDHLYSVLLSSNSGGETPHDGLNSHRIVVCRPYACPSSTVNTNFSLEHDLEHRVRLGPPLLEATVDAVTRLTGLMRFGVDEHVQHTCPHDDR